MEKYLIGTWLRRLKSLRNPEPILWEKIVVKREGRKGGENPATNVALNTSDKGANSDGKGT